MREGCDVFAKGGDDNDIETCSVEGQTLSAVSDKNPVFDSNISGLQEAQPFNT